MTRIAALNDCSLGSSEEEDVGPTREALEAQANKDYNNAIVHLAHHNIEKALENFSLVLQNPYVEKACWPDGVKQGGTLPQDVALRYSCLKNLGNLAATQGDHEQATKHYLEAVQLDSTEVTVWLRMGASAIKLKDFELALVAFQEGLLVNPKHWPCLDQLLSVLFILEMYMDCLGIIINALKRDPQYPKANAFKDKIFELQPSLKKDVKNFYRDSDILFRKEKYDHTLGDKFVKTCELLRPSPKIPRAPSPFPLQHLRKPLNKLTWDDLAESLLATYDDLVETEGMAFASRIDIHEALKVKEVMAQKGEEGDRNSTGLVNETKPINESVGSEGKECSINSKSVDLSPIDKEEKKNTSNKSPNTDERAPGTEFTDNSQVPRRISSRRQTIELGESQDSFRVSEKRRSVDSDTFSHPDDELRNSDEGVNPVSEKTSKDEGVNQASEKRNLDERASLESVKRNLNKASEKRNLDEVNLASEKRNLDEGVKLASEKRNLDEGVNVLSEKTDDGVSDKDMQDIQMTEKDKINGCKEVQDSGISVSKTKDTIEVNICDTPGACKEIGSNPCKRDIDSPEDPERKKQKTEHVPVSEKSSSGFPVTPVENTNLGAEEQAVNSNPQEKEVDNIVSETIVQSDNKDNTKTQGDENITPPTVPVISSEPVTGDGVSYETNELQGNLNVDEQILNSFHPDSENRNTESTGAPSSEVVKDKNVARALFEPEVPQTDPEEEHRENYLEDMEGGEQQGMEEEPRHDLVGEVEDEEGGLLSTEVTETEAAVNALKGIMALQPTEILGLPEPEYDYDNEYHEYFDGGVYEEEDEEEEGYQQEGEDEMGHMEGMEQIEGMEHEGLGGTAMEQEGVSEPVEKINEDGVEQGMNKAGGQEMSEDGVEHGGMAEVGGEQGMNEVELEGNEGNRQQEEINRHNENNDNNIEGNINEAIAEQIKSIQKDEQKQVIENTADQSEQEGIREEATEVRSNEGHKDTEEKMDTEQAQNSEGQNVNKEIHPVRQEFDQQGDGDLEDNVGDESLYRDESEQRVNQNEEETEAGSITEKRNSTEDDTPQETDTEAEGSKVNADKDESNKESGTSGDTASKTIVDNTDTNKTEEDKTGRVGRKPKRHKRGLERELEQLDYWGRRQERDAKRRRRTISSKLLGTIEETEYLTWGDLLRSFIPTSLLTYGDDKDLDKLLQQNLPTGKSDDRASYCGLPLSLTDTGTVSMSSVQNNATTEKTDEPKIQIGCSTKSKEDINEGGRLEEKMDVDVGKKNELGEKEKEASNTQENGEKVKEDGSSEKMDDGNLDTSKKINGDKEKTDTENVVVKEENDADVDKKKNYTEETEKSKTDVDSVADVKKKREEFILSSSVKEEEQVEAFLLWHENNGGILDLLQPFLLVLWKRHTNIWPVSAAKIFTRVYPRVRNHVRHAEALDLRENHERLYQDSMLALTHWELMISLYNTAKVNAPPSEQRNLVNPFSLECEHLEDDLFQLTLMLGRGDILMADTPHIHTRLRWLQAQVSLGQDKPEQAVSYLQLLLLDLERLSEGGPEFVMKRTHVDGDPSVVSHVEVRRHLNFLQRAHMLEQVVDNYTDGRYQNVAELLTTIFHEPPPKSRQGVTLPTRQTQLAILIDSLFRLRDYKGVISWGAQGLAEALMRYNRAEADEEKNRWAKTLMKISETMSTTLEHNINIMDVVDRVRVVQLVTTLVSMLVIQLEKSPNAHVLPFDTLSPWMLLHRMLEHEEQVQRQAESEKKDLTQEGDPDKASENQKPSSQENSGSSGKNETNGDNKATEEKGDGQEDESSTENKDPVVLYPSTLFLITAHDELGKHSWCSNDEGLLLLYCLDVLVEEGQRDLSSQHKQLLQHTLEQVSFCLYSYPSKKSKHKHLRDHGVNQIPLCWDRAIQLYRFYCPPQLPDFQSSQIASITDDVASLFKRIIGLFPDTNQPENHIESVEAYISGKEEECKYTPIIPPSDVVRDCFYLLGDYYFKNKEWNNAIKYYKLDLTMNKDRLESWAPLGLTMKAILETQLNSCEVIKDLEEFFAMAQAGVRCLHQALLLDEYHTNLWVEFGGLVYMVHSHASRLLKQDLNPDISLEMFELLEKLKGEMLKKAEQCFSKALTIQEEGWDDDGLPDERWLHCYMLGKVSEKQTKPPEIILQYYVKASEHLHNIHARYPNRINYNSPQEYSVEALEMYYRPHAYILKYLQQREGKSVEKAIEKTFTKFLDKFAKGSFACLKEWKSTDDDKTDAFSDSVVCDTEKEDEASQKKKDEDKEVEIVNEPEMTKLSEDKMDIIKDVIEELIHDAIELACQRDDKNEGTDDVEKIEGAKNKDPIEVKDKRDSDDEIQVVEEKVIEKHDHVGLIGRCISALKLCLSRFSQHYKAMYRLSYYYNNSKYFKDCSKARNYLLGCDYWQRVGYMPVNGLFNERKVWIQQPRNCNFFHGVWRIPNDEVDRPGSFAAHMYRCVSLTLDVLPQVKDFYAILQIALALKNSPEKDKKYLRDNERELLSEHATQVGLQAMKDKYKFFFCESTNIQGNRRMQFLLDVFRSYKQISRHLPGSEAHLAKMLTDAYASYRSISQENKANLLREADAFCTRNQHLQHRITPVTTTPVSQSSQHSPSCQSSSMSNMSSISRRGRPPGPSRGRGRGTYSQQGSTSNLKAIQEAYKLYENLLRIQTLINSKTLDQAGRYTQQKELEYCQSELLKYLRIPCVSQYFQSTLQGNSPAGKLPPPSKVFGSGSTTTPTTQGQGVRTSQSGSSQPRPSLSALAARSQAHGISITSVSSKKLPTTTSASTGVKPSMSVTVSPIKESCPSALNNRRGISVISLAGKTTPTSTITSTVSKPTENSSNAPSAAPPAKPSSPKPVSTQSNPSTTPNSQSNISVPKLPPGTTLTRPRDTPNKISGPRPQLQAQARPAKTQNTDSALDGLSSPMRKMATDIMSTTSPSTARSCNSGNGGKDVSSDQVNKPSLPKGMTITPAPRIKKPQATPAKPPLTTTQQSTYLGAYQASLGLTGNKPSPVRGSNNSPNVSGSPGNNTSSGRGNSSSSSSSSNSPSMSGNNNAGRGSSSSMSGLTGNNTSAGKGSVSNPSMSASVIRGEGQNISTSPIRKQLTQLSTSQLMQLAYGKGTPGKGLSGLANQFSKKQQGTGQPRPQAHQPGSAPQRFPSPSLQRSQPIAGQRGTQPRPSQQIRSSQIRPQSQNKPVQNSGQDKKDSSDDIITLD